MCFYINEIVSCPSLYYLHLSSLTVKMKPHCIDLKVPKPLKWGCDQFHEHFGLRGNKHEGVQYFSIQSQPNPPLSLLMAPRLDLSVIQTRTNSLSPT